MCWGILLCIVYDLRIIQQAYLLRMYSVLARRSRGKEGDAYEIVAGDFVSRDFCFVVGRGGCFFVCVQQIFVEVGCCAKRI